MSTFQNKGCYLLPLVDAAVSFPCFVQAKRLAIVELCLALVAFQDQGLAMNLLEMVHQCPVVLVVLMADDAEEVALGGSLVVELDLIIALAIGGRGGCSRAAGGAQDRQVSWRVLGHRNDLEKKYVT